MFVCLFDVGVALLVKGLEELGRIYTYTFKLSLFDGLKLTLKITT